MAGQTSLITESGKRNNGTLQREENLVDEMSVRVRDPRRHLKEERESGRERASGKPPG